MAYSEISAAETDADSPHNQSLMDKVSGNIDHLNDNKLNTKVFYGTLTQSGDNYVTLDSTIDWTDRIVSVVGAVFVRAVGTNIGDNIPGGSEDDQIGSGALGSPTSDRAKLSGWMYTENGGANKDTNPRVTAAYETNTGNDVILWLNASGHLMLTCEIHSTDYDNFAYTLRVDYSEQLGAI